MNAGKAAFKKDAGCVSLAERSVVFDVEFRANMADFRKCFTRAWYGKLPSRQELD